MTITRDQVEAYVYATEDHRAQGDWEDILEFVSPMARRTYIRLELYDPEDWVEAPNDEDMQEQCLVEEYLIGADDEAKAIFFEDILKAEGIFD